MEKLTKRKQQALETREKIFHHAINLFANDTYEKITVQDICNSAGVSVGAFYHHYSSKADILDKGYRLFDDMLEKKWADLNELPPLSAIRELIIFQIDSLSNLGIMATLQYFKNQLTNGQRYIINKDRFFYKKMKHCIEQAVNNHTLTGHTTTITDELLSTSRGIIYDWCLHDGSYSLKEMTIKITNMILEHYMCHPS